VSHHRVSGRAVATLVVAVLLLAGCASGHRTTTSAAVGAEQTTKQASSPPVGATVTKFRVFAPYDRSGAPTAGVAAHRSGSCFTTSITVMAADAYRCFAGNSLLDPCFASPDKRLVLECYLAPWSRPIELRVRTLPSASSPLTITRPWAIQLAAGARCVATNGTPNLVRGVALSYACPDGFAGLRTTTGRTLTALYRATDGLVRVSRVTIAWSAATN
jgi:hypothetical protein